MQKIVQEYSRNALIISSVVSRLKDCDLDFVSLLGSKILVRCKKCNKQFPVSYSNIKIRKKLNISICNCKSSTSFPEKTILSFISKISSSKIIPNDREQLGDMELDIYLPKQSLAFEFNGLYWHSEAHKPKHYHKTKTEYAEKKNIHLVHIWSDDWDKKQSIVKSYIRNMLLENDKRIYVKDCIVKKITVEEARDFHARNSLEKHFDADVCYGIYNESLVSVMCFKKVSGEWFLTYFCNDLDIAVIGGYKRMFSEFVSEYSPSKIYSIANRDWFRKENLDYRMLGFQFAKYLRCKSVRKSGKHKVFNSGYIKFSWSLKCG
jgi:hypothetical protein